MKIRESGVSTINRTLEHVFRAARSEGGVESCELNIRALLATLGVMSDEELSKKAQNLRSSIQFASERIAEQSDKLDKICRSEAGALNKLRSNYESLYTDKIVHSFHKEETPEELIEPDVDIEGLRKFVKGWRPVAPDLKRARTQIMQWFAPMPPRTAPKKINEATSSFDFEDFVLNVVTNLSTEIAENIASRAEALNALNEIETILELRKIEKMPSFVIWSKKD